MSVGQIETDIYGDGDGQTETEMAMETATKKKKVEHSSIPKTNHLVQHVTRSGAEK